MKAFQWLYRDELYTSKPLATKCPTCGKRAIVALTGTLLTEQTGGTTHLCHPLAKGCNHGFAMA